MARNHNYGKRAQTGRGKAVCRRALALFLALVMSMSLVQISVFAAEDVQDAEVVTNGQEVNSEDGKVSIQKTVRHTDGNNFEITLRVTTKDTVTTTPKQGASVVLVMDRSNSMGSDRFSNARTAANDFVDKLLSKDGNKVAVVGFGNNYVVHSQLTDNVETAKSAIQNATKSFDNTYHGGTNLQAGIYAARSILEKDTSDTNKVIVLFSDGAPTYSYKATVTGTWTGCTTDRNGRHNWNDNRNGGGQGTATDYSNVQYTTSFDSNNLAGNGSNYQYSTTVTYTCAHGNTKRDNQGRANNGAPAIAEAQLAKNIGTTIYGVYLGTDTDATSTMQGIASGADYFYSTADVEQLAELFGGIAESVITATKAGKVTDPMGQFIILGTITEDMKAHGITVAEDGKSLIWDTTKAQMTEDKENHTKTYTITYPITLDTSAVGFVEGQPYATNGTTTFTYMVDGEERSLDFDVPTVRGYLPEYAYTVEYYLQGDAQKGDFANYTLDETFQGPKTDLHTSVNAPEGYESKYDAQNYAFESGTTQIVITAGENVMRLYYCHITADVTVNHYYKLTTINEDGSVTKGVYPELPNLTTNDKANVGDSYTAVKEPVYSGVEYTFDAETSDNETITVAREKNIINLYYQAELDLRKEATVVVDHVYRFHTWVLENGKYVPTSESVTVPRVEEATSKATATYTASKNPVEGKEDYTYDPANVNEIVLKEGENKITLFFDKTVDPRVETAVTVNHHYTKTVTTVVNGQVETKTYENEVNEETVTCYVGETFTAKEQNVYGSDTYVSDAGNAGKLTIVAQANGNVIDLYYSLTVAPEKTNVTVNHYYYTVTKTTVEKVENGVVVGTEIVESITQDGDPTIAKITGLYVGEAYEAALEGKDGYTFDAEKSDPRTGNALPNDGSVVNLNYYRYAEEDTRAAATIDVQHVYVTHLTTIVNGEIKTVDVQDGSFIDQDYTGKAGDRFTAETEPTYQNNTYTVVGEPTLTKVLQPGTNATIVIHYERSASNLVETNYQVNYVYNTYTWTVVDGVAQWVLTTESGEPFYGTGFVGQNVTLPDGAKAGFTADPQNPATQQTLAESGNTWTFVYERRVNDLEKVTVTVNHHYSLTTIAVDGTSSTEVQDVFGTPAEKYKDETFLAQAEKNGYTLDRYTVTEGITAAQAENGDITGTASKNVVVDFYYSKTEDKSVPATLDVKHIYRVYNWDGTLNAETETENPTVTSFATKTLVAAADAKDYTLTEATLTQASGKTQLDVTAGPDYPVVLQQGANQVVFTYEKTLPRPDYAVKVVHEYYYADVTGETEGRFEENYDLPDASEFTATLRTENNGIPYEFVSATPENYTVLVSADAEKNTITIKYVRANTTYQVIHSYYTNGQLDGQAEPIVVNAKAGDLVKAEDIEKVLDFQGNTYTYTSADAESITVAADGSSVITLRYDRTYTPPYVPGTYTVTVNYYDKATGAKIAQSYVESHSEFTSYNVTAKDAIAIDGYTYVETTGDALTGTMTGNKVINVYYSKDADIDEPDVPLDPGTDIEDPDVPLDPGTDIEDPDVPLSPAQPPKTGDSLGLWIAAAAVSGLCLVGLLLSGKKRKEEV